MVVYKMATVGCVENNGSMDSEDLAARNSKPVMSDLCKKNGINHNCFLAAQVRDCFESKAALSDKIPKLNGCNFKAFPKPSIPTLRSRKDKCSPELPKRKRRPSRHDSTEVKERTSENESGTKKERKAGEVLDRIKNSKSLTPEVSTVTTTTTSSCSSSSSSSSSSSCSSSRIQNEVPHPDILHRSSMCSDQSSPDTSRSCTPMPIPSIFSSHGNKDTTATTNNNNNSKPPQAEEPVSCQWKDCDKTLDPSILMDHIRQSHVDPQAGSETFVCLWVGCKVYNKMSCSMSWLERHIINHSGDKPYKCIVAGCGQRFTSQGGLERHVNSHFNTLPPANHKILKQREDTPTKLLRKRKSKRRRPQLNKTGDFFDSGIMGCLQQELEDLTRKTDLTGLAHSVTFHSIVSTKVTAKRKEDSGKVKVLLHWNPENILPDTWVPESQVPDLSVRVIPLTQLPRETAVNLHPSLYRGHRFRKHRRK